MIQAGSHLNVVDNSGAKKVLCIKILQAGFKQRYASIGNMILVSIKSVKFSDNLKVKKGELHRALIIRTKIQQYSLISNYKKYYQNSVVLLNKKHKNIGTRIFGLIPKKFKYSKFLRLTSISSGLTF